MAFYKSLITGVTAMTSQGSAMGVLSDNIANARTVGFKGSESIFATLVVNDKPSNLNAGHGVSFSKANHLNQQGMLSVSQTSTNFAIMGRGFFPVASALDPRTGQIPPTGERLVTRAGDFSLNKDGYLVNAKGYALLGLPANAAGTATANAFGALVPIKVPAVSALPAEASKQVILGGNLSATDAVPLTTTEANTVDAAGNTVPGATKTKPGAKVETQVSVYDAKGGQYNLEITLNKTGPQTWTAQITGASSPDGTKLSVTGAGEPITLAFDAKGQLTTPTGDITIGSLVLAKRTQVPRATPDGEITPNEEAATTSETVTTLNFNLRFKDQAGKPTLTGFGASTNLSSSTTDGHGLLGYRGLDLRDNGALYQLFDQGKRLAVASIPVVTFANEDGLEAVSGTAYRVTASSGDPLVNLSNTNGAGKVMGGQLEESNVDLAEEFSDMIITQRAFQAASKIVTTSDAMIEVVRDLKR